MNGGFLDVGNAGRSRATHAGGMVDRIGLKPVIDARYSFAELPKAMAHLRRGAFGKVVVQVHS
jgi:NADPH:quinone reductase-like Zn-dependent oxidoreductase